MPLPTAHALNLPRTGCLLPLAAAAPAGGAAWRRPGAWIYCGGVRPGAAVQGAADHQPSGAGALPQTVASSAACPATAVLASSFVRIWCHASGTILPPCLVSILQEEWDEEAHPEGFDLSGSLPAAEVEQGPTVPAAAGEPAALPTTAAQADRKKALQETAEGVVILTSDDEGATGAAAGTSEESRAHSMLGCTQCCSAAFCALMDSPPTRLINPLTTLQTPSLPHHRQA